MKRILLFSAAASLVVCSHAQSNFEKYYEAPNGAGLIELASHNLLVGMAYSSTVNAAGTSRLDAEGNFIGSHLYENDTMLAIQSVKKLAENEFYFVTGYYTGTCISPEGATIQQTHPVIGRMDSLGNVLAVQHYEMNEGCRMLARGVEVTTDGGAIAWGWEWNPFILKVNHELEHIWSKHFAGIGSIQFIKELPGGDLLAGINLVGAGASLARLDANGNILWSKSYVRPRGVVHDCVVESDDSFLITGYTDSIASTNGFAPLPSEYHPKLFLMKLDGGGAVQWCKGYESTTTWYSRYGQSVARTSDGDYLLLANLNVPDHNIPARPFLIKTDMNGDTLWTRSAGRQSYRYETGNLIVCSDGGIFHDGMAYGDIGLAGGVSYIFKTDADGHLPCSDAPAPPLSLSDLFPTDSSFTLTSVDGAIALPAYVQDAPYDDIIAYDGCFVTSITSSTYARKARVYPNPTTGRFLVEFRDPLMVECYYSVYDALGKLLYQRPLPSGTRSEEVDLSRFGQGAYLLKFTDPAGVCYERIVVSP